MRICEIRKFPTGSEAFAIHESVFRAYHILNKVEDLLKRGVPTDVILELIEEMESAE